MGPGKLRVMAATLCLVAVMVFSCLWSSVEAFPHGERAVRVPHGEAVEGPRGNVAVHGEREKVAVGTRRAVLPYSARTVVVADRTYYVDENDVYYVPCEDDDTFYCVVAAPE